MFSKARISSIDVVGLADWFVSRLAFRHVQTVH